MKYFTKTAMSYVKEDLGHYKDHAYGDRSKYNAYADGIIGKLKRMGVGPKEERAYESISKIPEMGPKLEGVRYTESQFLKNVANGMPRNKAAKIMETATTVAYEQPGKPQLLMSFARRPEDLLGEVKREPRAFRMVSPQKASIPLKGSTHKLSGFLDILMKKYR